MHNWNNHRRQTFIPLATSPLSVKIQGNRCSFGLYTLLKGIQHRHQWKKCIDIIFSRCPDGGVGRSRQTLAKTIFGKTI
jgi:hypothetical protein